MSDVVLSTAYFPPIEWMAHYVQQNSFIRNKPTGVGR